MAGNHTSSLLVGDIRWSETRNKLSESGEEKVYRTAEEFLFELSGLMKEYGVVKIDVCVDAYAYAEHLINTA
jgi:hypothetical protein